jgi:hypothetical protein
VLSPKAFKEAVKRTTEFRGGIYVPPYHDLRWKFLVQAKEELQAHLQVKMVENVHKFGATFIVGFLACEPRSMSL